MTNPLGRLLVAVAVLATATSLVPSAAFATPDRQEPCAQAWGVIAAETASLADGSLDAWNRVAEAFLSFSDATFDGPLSNAFGDVAAAADAMATSIQSDEAAGALPARFHTAIAAMGTVCAQLVTTPHKEAVPRFQRFSYQTGTVTGLSPEAGALVNPVLESTVQRSVRSARRANAGACEGNSARCGYFIETLHQRPCVAGAVCVLMKAGLLPVGANSSESTAKALPFDALTGKRLPLTRVVPPADVPAFLSQLNAAVTAVLRNGGIVDLAYWKPHVTLDDVRSWLPQPDGLHVWFDKYAVAPGSFGVVEVVVPWPSVGRPTSA